MPPKEAPEPIRLETLAPQQLMELRANLNNEIQKLSEGMGALARASNTLNGSRKAVEQFGTSTPGQSTMLPLTSSLYVLGEVDDVEKVLVDIGTGYYVEMITADACKYYERRIKSIQDNMKAIESTLRERQTILMQVQSVLAEKMSAASARA